MIWDLGKTVRVAYLPRVGASSTSNFTDLLRLERAFSPSVIIAPLISPRHKDLGDEEIENY